MTRLDELFSKIASSPSGGQITHIIVGLGNPGKEYERTRHNMGYMALDAVAASVDASVTRYRFRALTGEAVIGGVRCLLMKPETFMNLSGDAVGEAARFYKIPPENIYVLCDDISFPVGRLRYRKSGSAGGHNGLKSIIAAIGSEDFPRIKLGVGQKPSPTYDLADWVLSRIPEGEMPKASEVFSRVASVLPLFLKGEETAAVTLLSK